MTQNGMTNIHPRAYTLRMNKNLLIFIICAGIFLGGLGVDLYAPSLPHIATALHASATLTKLTITAFLLGIVFGQIVFGVLSDTYGRKRPLIAGYTLFVIISFAAIFSTNIYFLLACRLLQGFSFSCASVIGKALLADNFTGKKLTVASTYMTIAWGLGPIVGPVIGGYLQFYYGWQANFYFFALYGLVLLLLATLFLKRTHQQLHPLHFGKIAHNVKTVLSHRIWLGGVLSLGIGYSMIVIFNVVGPFLIQNTLHYNALVYGHVALFVGGAYFFGTLANRLLLHKFSPKLLVKVGLLIITAATLLLLGAAYEMKLTIGSIALPIFIIVVGVGLVFPNAMAKTISLFPKMGGIANALQGSCFLLGTTLSTLIMSLLPHSTLVAPAWAFMVLMLMQWAVYIFMS